MAAAAIEGRCDRRFAAVEQALAENFAARGEHGAAVAVIVGGSPVVDIWGGWMDEARTRPWHRDTLVGIFSVGKAMAALCPLILAQRGQLDLGDPVSRHWPEFADAGKEAVTVRMLLAHRAGLPAVRRELPEDAGYDWELMVDALAHEEPWWPPGTTHGYHVNTFGFLVGEIVRRVAGESIGSFLRREVSGPLDADFHLGLAAREDHRVAEYTFGTERSGSPAARAVDDDRRFLLGRVYLNPPALSGIGTANTRAWRAAEIPSTNSHATARAVAQVYDALTRGRLLDGDALADAIAEHSSGADFVLGRPSRFGLGFQLTQPERPLGPNARSFGHFGAGGSLGFADLDAEVAFAYVMNRSGPRWQNPRNRALIEALYSCL